MNNLFTQTINKQIRYIKRIYIDRVYANPVNYATFTNFSKHIIYTKKLTCEEYNYFRYVDKPLAIICNEIENTSNFISNIPVIITDKKLTPKNININYIEKSLKYKLKIKSFETGIGSNFINIIIPIIYDDSSFINKTSEKVLNKLINLILDIKHPVGYRIRYIKVYSKFLQDISIVEDIFPMSKFNFLIYKTGFGKESLVLKLNGKNIFPENIVNIITQGKLKINTKSISIFEDINLKNLIWLKSTITDEMINYQFDNDTYINQIAKKLFFIINTLAKEEL